MSAANCVCSSCTFSVLMRLITNYICTLEPCTSLFPHQTLHITAMWPLFSRAYLACKGLCSLCLVAYLGLPRATPSLSSSALPECRVFSSKQRMQSLAETYAGGLLGSSLCLAGSLDRHDSVDAAACHHIWAHLPGFFSARIDTMCMCCCCHTALRSGHTQFLAGCCRLLLPAYCC